jgi:uncharacterized membrane protein
MAHHPDQINQLLDQMELLIKKQEALAQEINALKTNVVQLARMDDSVSIPILAVPVVKEVEPEPIQPAVTMSAAEILETLQPPSPPKNPFFNQSFEKFIGENLINKIGIIILVLGVGIGTKYAIDHELISPLTRIIFGYLCGAGLLALAFRLKQKYEGYSAVLLSGSMAILYFLTFAAHAYYQLIPAPLAYGLMVMLTVFTVVAAIQYNRQVIGIIGLVGAYAVPFLLSDGSGNVGLLFTYIVVINFGILTISILRYWQYLMLAAFVVTSAIFLYWYGSAEEFSATMAGAFTFLFFLQFYLAILGNKVKSTSKLVLFDYLMLLANSTLFYGIGYDIIQFQPQGEEFLGLFTLGNALLHFIVSLVVYRQKLIDKNLYLITAAFVLLFITIAIPVQLNGNWVTLVWAIQALVLFWLGRSKGVAHLDKAAYALIFVALISLVQDWSLVVEGITGNETQVGLSYFFNIRFLTTFTFLAALVGIYRMNTIYPTKKTIWEVYLEQVLAVLILFVLYFGIRAELSGYYDAKYMATALRQLGTDEVYPLYNYNYDILQFKNIALLNFTLIFLVFLSVLNFRKIRHPYLANATLILLILTFFAFLFQGVGALSYLRDSLMFPTPDFATSWWNIGIRYFSYLIFGIALWAAAQHKDLIADKFKIILSMLVHFFVLALLTVELTNILIWTGEDSFTNVGVSLLWGVYAMFMIVVGIWKKNKVLRLAGIGLFSITLLKFFLFDIIGMSTLGKTAIFVGLGILLLLISFLYNKYKHKISDEPEI